MRPNISVSITTWNEEKYVEEALKSIKGWADEIIVIDGSSQDKTVEICKKYTPNVFVVPNNLNLNVNKQLGFTKCTSLWIFYLDADESIPQNLKNEIDQLLSKETEHTAYTLFRKNILNGIPLTYDWPGYQVRLFKKGKANFKFLSVHEELTVDGSVGVLQQPFFHFGWWRGMHHYIAKMNNYTTNDARCRVDLGENYSLFKLLLKCVEQIYVLTKNRITFNKFPYGLFFLCTDIVTELFLFFKMKELSSRKKDKR